MEEIKMGMFLRLLGDTSTGVQDKEWYTNILKPIVDGINTALWPIIIIVAAVGAIYAVWLGVQLAKAESEEARTEAKKKMLYFIIAFVVTIIILVLLKLLAANVDTIFGLVSQEGTPTE